jgi:hypothetical protein
VVVGVRGAAAACAGADSVNAAPPKSPGMADSKVADLLGVEPPTWEEAARL